MNTFTAFKDQFVQQISRRDFGAKPGDIDEVSLSPGRKELDAKKQAMTTLTKDTFLQAVFKLVRESRELENEQASVREVTKQAKPTIKSLRDAQKSLRAVNKRIGEIDHRLESIAGWNTREHLRIAVEELKDAVKKLVDLEGVLVSSLHPASKLPARYERSSWKVLIKPFNYDLDTLRKLAPRQWLIDVLDAKLGRTFRRAGVKISTATCHRIIAAVFSASGLEPIDPLTLKEYFGEKRKLDKALARNSASS